MNLRFSTKNRQSLSEKKFITFKKTSWTDKNIKLT